MPVQTVKNGDTMISGCLSFFQQLLAGERMPDFAIRLWEGTTWISHPDREARFTLVINHPGALRRLFWAPNQLTLGKAYIYGDYDVEGDIVEAINLASHLCDLKLSVMDKLRFGRVFLGLARESRPLRAARKEAHLKGKLHSPERDAKAISYHYNVSNDFYRLWLDEKMVYSCAYFSTPTDSIDSAQQRKLDFICRKLRLKKGDRLLDIGCGWGGLIIHAALNYGVDAIGITLSSPQAELAKERIKDAGIADRCRVEVRDYREIADSNGFDKLVSIGMIEHVGRQKLPEYFASAWRLLRPKGVFLNAGISSSLTFPPLKGPSFIDRYVFPDGDLPPICDTLRAAEECGFEVRDVESLREHYALTLRQWIRRLEDNHEAAQSLTDEVTYRIWRLYMAGSAHGFDVGYVNLYHSLLVKSDRGKSGLPLTRNDWYG
jgi:cyclopropane-fatty-acyl-phospholipid synthase